MAVDEGIVVHLESILALLDRPRMVLAPILASKPHSATPSSRGKTYTTSPRFAIAIALATVTSEARPSRRASIPPQHRVPPLQVPAERLEDCQLGFQAPLLPRPLARSHNSTQAAEGDGEPGGWPA